MCRQALEMSGSQGLLTGFFWSILLIAGAPLLIAAIISFLFYRHRQKTPSRNIE